MRALRPLLPMLQLALASIACDAGVAGPGTSAAGDPLSPQDPALAWLGTFRGEGGGTLAGKEVRWSDVELIVRFDDAGVAAGCQSCLTLTLGDTLFRAINVRPGSAVELEVTRANPYRRTLRLHRYSGSGGTGNVVEAELTASDSAGVALEALFVLAR